MKKVDFKNVDVKNLKEKSGGFISEFKSFILRGNVMDMAIGVIIGGAFSSIVTALTEDFINPLINSIGGAEVGGKFQLPWTSAEGTALLYGNFITAVINFVIMAFVLFCLLKFVNGIANAAKRKEEVPEIAKDPNTELLEEIRDLLKAQNKKSK